MIGKTNSPRACRLQYNAKPAEIGWASPLFGFVLAERQDLF
jgi:hypothetical protein